MIPDTAALGDVVLAIGRPEFAQCYQAFCHQWLDADDSLAFVLPDRAAPRVVLRSPAMNGLPPAPDMATSLYFGGAYKKDGNLRYQGSLRQPAVRVIDASDRRLEPTQRQVYDLGNIVQMVTLVSRSGNARFCLGFYKKDHGRFPARTIAAIENARFLLLSPVHRHHQLSLAAEGSIFGADGGPAGRETDIGRIAAVLLAATGLTPREAEVCARAMTGYSVLATGLDMGLSASTASIHRARAFAKLGISTVKDLFAVYGRSLDRLRNISAH